MTLPSVQYRNRRTGTGFGLNWVVTVFSILSGFLVFQLLRPDPHMGDMDHALLHKAKLIDQEVDYPEISYDLVIQEDKLMHFVAKEKWFDGPSQNITVHRWLTLANHPDHAFSNRVIQTFLQVLRTSQMNAFFFETNGVSFMTAYQKPFEFVLIPNQQLFDFADARQDPSHFGDKLACGQRVKEHSDSDDDEDEGNDCGCVFRDGDDATLIAPKAWADTANNTYGHLAAFLHRAPEHQVVYTWRLALETFLGKMEQDKFTRYWFSTNGRGAKWLHFRIDSKPKYYDYKPFAVET